jgi:hypothetical protein
VHELFDANRDRWNRRDGFFDFEDAGGWLARNQEIVRHYLNPEECGGVRGWEIMRRADKDALAPFDSELTSAATGTKKSLRSDVRPLVLRAAYDLLNEPLRALVENAPAEVRKNSLDLLCELAPAEQRSFLIAWAEATLVKERSAAVCSSLETLKRSEDQVEHPPIQVHIDLDAALDPKVRRSA